MLSTGLGADQVHIKKQVLCFTEGISWINEGKLRNHLASWRKSEVRP